MSTEPVSPREAEVMALLDEHLSNVQIAGRLGISVRTVENHVSSLLRKYGVADRRALAAIARRRERAPARVSGPPTWRTGFVGRAHERDAVQAMLQPGRLVTLTGPGGVGKTRLAASVAPGAAFVDLVPVREGQVTRAVATALGLGEQAGLSLEETVASALGSERQVLVLDNCEHVLDAVAGFADRVLSACPGTRILVTSRERLAVPGERVVPVSPLPLSSDAEALFLDRATAADPAFSAPDEVLVALCARLDGMPLAIELAAARSATLGADGLLSALDDSLRLLAGGRGGDERHRSLRAVLGWSHDLLDAEEQALFRRLGMFVGTFDLDAVTAVAADGDRMAAIDVLGRLVDKSLVAYRGRWRLLETVRAFALDQLEASGEAPEVRERYVRWANDTAAAMTDGFDAVGDDLRAALALAPSHGLARSLAVLTYRRRFVMESIDHYRQAAALAPDPAESAQDYRKAAACALAIAQAGVSFELYEAAAEQARLAGDGDMVAISLSAAVTTATRHRGFGMGEPVPYAKLASMVDEARAAGDQGDATVAAYVAVAAAWNAACAVVTPDPAFALAAVEAVRAAGDDVLISCALDAVLSAEASAGRLAEAYRLAGERFALLRSFDRDEPRAGIEIVDAFHTSSTYAMAVGDLPEAVSVSTMVQRDDLVGSNPALATSKLVPPLVLTGDFDEALRYAAMTWNHKERAERWMAPTACAAALAYGLLGDRELSASWRERADAIFAPGGLAAIPNMAPMAAFTDARVALQNGSFENAAELVERAFADFLPGWFVRYARPAGAELAIAAGLPDAAERLADALPDGEDNLWAAACLSRCRGRLYGDAAELRASAEAFDRIGATFERDYTLSVATAIAPGSVPTSAATDPSGAQIADRPAAASNPPPVDPA